MFWSKKTIWNLTKRIGAVKEDIMQQVTTYIMCLATLLVGSVHANIDISFGEPNNLGLAFNTPYNEGAPRERVDNLERFIGSDRTGTYGDYDLWVATRATTGDDWSSFVNLGPTINTSYFDSNPSISADGLKLFFSSARPSGLGSSDIWVTMRPTVSNPWSAPVNLGSTVNSFYWDAVPSISSDGLSIFFESERPGGYGDVDIWVTTRSTVFDTWGLPINLGPAINSADSDGAPSISADGLALFFTSNRGGYGFYDLWMTTRETISDPWGTPMNLGPTVNSSEGEGWSAISADGSILYFASRRIGGYGGWDAWQVPIFYEPVCGDNNHPYPIGDLNHDCRVNFSDIAILCEHWLEDNNP